MPQPESKNGTLKILEEKCEVFLRSIESGKYQCIHDFCRYFARYVQADQMLVFQESESGWMRISSIRESVLGDRTVLENREIEEKTVIEKTVQNLLVGWLKQITWLPGEMGKKRFDLKERPESATAIPIWRDVGHSIKKCLIVLVKPRLLDLQLRIETPPLDVPLSKMFYRVIYYWLSKGFYEHRIRGYMCRQITAGHVDLIEADASIKSPEKGLRGLIDQPFGWPADFREVNELFGACWFVYLRILEAGETADKPEERPEKTFWERDGRPDITGVDIAWWDYLESEAQQKLCHSKPLCKQPVCPIEEQHLKNVFSEMCTFIKWPLLFIEKKYNYLSLPANETRNLQQWLESKYDQVACFNKLTHFLEVEEIEERMEDEYTRKRSFVCLR